MILIVKNFLIFDLNLCSVSCKLSPFVLLQQTLLKRLILVPIPIPIHIPTLIPILTHVPIGALSQDHQGHPGLPCAGLVLSSMVGPCTLLCRAREPLWARTQKCRW